MTSRTAGVLASVGLLAGEIGGALMHFPPFLPQKALRTLAGSIVVVALAVITACSLLFWAKADTGGERLAFVLAILFVGGSAVILNVLAPAGGWWAGPVFEGPRFPLATLTGLRAMFIVSIVLIVYRWVAARRHWLAVAIYVAILIALIPGIVRADAAFLSSGVLVFARGYRIWHDVILGEFFFASAVVLYELARERSHVA